MPSATKSFPSAVWDVGSLMLPANLRTIVAAALVLTASAKGVFAASQILGSVSATGAVELRGVEIVQEGTLFAGDSIRVHGKAYATVLLRNGSKIGLAEKTDVNFSPER